MVRVEGMGLVQPGEGKVSGVSEQPPGTCEEEVTVRTEPSFVQSRMREQTQIETRKALTGQKRKLFSPRTVKQQEGVSESLCNRLEKALSSP